MNHILIEGNVVKESTLRKVFLLQLTLTITELNYFLLNHKASLNLEIDYFKSRYDAKRRLYVYLFVQSPSSSFIYKNSF